MSKKYKPESITDKSIIPNGRFYKIPGFDNYGISKKGDVILLNSVKSKIKNTVVHFDKLTKSSEISMVANNATSNRNVRIIRLLCLAFLGPVTGNKTHSFYTDKSLHDLDITKLKWVNVRDSFANLKLNTMQRDYYYYNVYTGKPNKVTTIAELSKIVDRVPSTITRCLTKEIPFLTSGFLISRDPKVNWVTLHNKLIGKL